LALALAVLTPAAASAALDAPAGARPAALGGAYSALADDAYAPAWNPAGLGLGRSVEAALLQGADFDGRARQAATLAVPVGARAGAGLALDFSNGRAAYGLAAGVSVTPRWSLGAAARRLDVSGTSGTSGDIAAMLRLDRRLSVAAVAANLGGRPEALRSGADAAQARLGAGYAANSRLTWSLEGVFDRAGAAGVRSGAEVVVWRTLAARVGVDSTAAGAPFGGFTAGFGLSFSGARLDLAAGSRNGGMTEQASLIARFGGARREPAALPETPPEAPRPLSARPPRLEKAVVARFDPYVAAPSTPTASGFIAEPPAPEWRKPRAPVVPEKPAIEEPVSPGLIWLGQ
jgi:hypothetical protein